MPLDKKTIRTISLTLSFLSSFLLAIVFFAGSHTRPITQTMTQTATGLMAGQIHDSNTRLSPLDLSSLYKITKVIDGDTIIVQKESEPQNNQTEHVRLIGIDTPETVDPRKPVQCFGKEASDFLKKLLSNKTVRLAADPTQDDRDKYHRLLRYVYLDDTLVNEEIIQSGYGFEYTYRIPYQFQKEFKESEIYARSGGIGLWATSTCNGGR